METPVGDWALELIDRLCCLVEPGVPRSVDRSSLAENWRQAKAEAGRQQAAVHLALHVEEFADLDSVITHLLAGQGAGEGRNEAILAYRLLGWVETIRARGVHIEVPTVGAADEDEDLARRQVRAIEIVVRQLLRERHVKAEDLVSHLVSLLDERVVRAWSERSQCQDPLSGCSFSALATLFVDKEEFGHHERFYAGTDFLTLLRSRRKTARLFLDDVRRMRNALAHNRKISPNQLRLLSIYYDELMSPIQAAHDAGQTSANPADIVQTLEGRIDGLESVLIESRERVLADIGELRSVLSADLLALGDSAQRSELGILALLRTARWMRVVAVVTLAMMAALLFGGGGGSGSASLAADVSELRRGYAELSGNGGLISQPQNVVHLLHNAEVRRGRGDAAGALSDYRRALSQWDIPLLDVQMTIAKVARAVLGPREVNAFYEELLSIRPSVALEVGHASLLEPEDRRLRYMALLEANPDSVLLMLVAASELSVGSGSFYEESLRGELSQALRDATDSGELGSIFLDVAIESQYRERVRGWGSVPARGFAHVSYGIGAQGWLGYIVPTEEVSDLSVALQRDGVAETLEIQSAQPGRLTFYLPGPGLLVLTGKDSNGRVLRQELVMDESAELRRILPEEVWFAFSEHSTGFVLCTSSLVNKDYEAVIRSVEWREGDGGEWTQVQRAAGPVPATFLISPNAQRVQARLTWASDGRQEIRDLEPLAALCQMYRLIFEGAIPAALDVSERNGRAAVDVVWLESSRFLSRAVVECLPGGQSETVVSESRFLSGIRDAAPDPERVRREGAGALRKTRWLGLPGEGGAAPEQLQMSLTWADGTEGALLFVWSNSNQYVRRR